MPEPSPQGSDPPRTPEARPAGPEDFEIFDSLRERRCPPGYFVGDGWRVVSKMIECGAVTRLLCTPEWLGRLPALAAVEVRTAPKERLDRLVGFRLHQGIMALGRIPPPPPRVSGTLLVALDGLSNAENVGAILRTCAAFGADGVLVGPTTASPWLRRAVRVSMAAPLRVPVHFVPDLAEAVRPLNAWAADLRGNRRPYTEVDYTAPVCLVLGGEDKGVTPEVRAACRGAVGIPMAPGWDCLNVAACAAVLLAEARRQRSAAAT
jgi:tRNA G18 (ribose-2'-O)-methylase SpoU